MTANESGRLHQRQRSGSANACICLGEWDKCAILQRQGDITPLSMKRYTHRCHQHRDENTSHRKMCGERIKKKKKVALISLFKKKRVVFRGREVGVLKGLPWKEMNNAFSRCQGPLEYFFSSLSTLWERRDSWVAYHLSGQEDTAVK